jgi:hypothetical protein
MYCVAQGEWFNSPIMKFMRPAYFNEISALFKIYYGANKAAQCFPYWSKDRTFISDEEDFLSSYCFLE